MRRRILLHSIVLLAGLSVIRPLAADEFKAPLARLELNDGDTVVFLGDSITHQCLYTQYVEDYFYTRFPKLKVNFHNAGVGGAKAWDALQRFERDVAAYEPEYVTVLLGMNDGLYQPFDRQTFETYRRDMTELIERIEKIGAVPVLLTPTMFDARAARLGRREHPPERLAEYNAVLAYYGAWLRERACAGGCGFVDLYSPLNNATLEVRKKQPRFTLIRDAVHPDPPGQVVMAYALVRNLVGQKLVSSIQIARTRSNKVVARVNGGGVSEMKFEKDGLHFTWAANRLPWILPEEAQPGARLIKLGTNMGREFLQVAGLASGKYELRIDGTVVGVYSHAALLRGVSLQDNAKTPQHQQALRVAELNKKRNDGPVKALRNQWRIFQQHSRLKARLAEAPDDEELRRQVESLSKRLEGFEERLQKHEKEAQAIEAEIRKANQPTPRKYVLKQMVLARTPQSGPGVGE